jgi:hypothetical protein
MINGNIWENLYAQWRVYRAPLGFGIRTTVAAISALLIAQVFALPLHGLWVVLTATVVTQLSVDTTITLKKIDERTYSLDPFPFGSDQLRLVSRGRYVAQFPEDFPPERVGASLCALPADPEF